MTYATCPDCGAEYIVPAGFHAAIERFGRLWTVAWAVPDGTRTPDWSTDPVPLHKCSPVVFASRKATA